MRFELNIHLTTGQMELTGRSTAIESSDNYTTKTTTTYKRLLSMEEMNLVNQIQARHDREYDDLLRSFVK